MLKFKPEFMKTLIRAGKSYIKRRQENETSKQFLCYKDFKSVLVSTLVYKTTEFYCFEMS